MVEEIVGLCRKSWMGQWWMEGQSQVDEGAGGWR